MATVLDRAMTTGRSVRTDDATVVPIVAHGHVVGAMVAWSVRPQTEEMLGAYVDHFKRFNDAHGHQIGDAVLQHVASVISANVRNGDLVYRYGGEEFAVLLPGADLDVAVEVVERVRSAIASTRLPGEVFASVPPVTVSAGVSVTPPADGAAMVRAADGVLYAAKSRGRNRVEAVVPA